MSGELTSISDDSFKDEVLRSEQPVLVDFWAPWCQPCLRLTPLLEKVAEEYAGKVKFVKINVEDNKATAAKYGIRGIPTLILIKDGNVLATKVGGVTATSELSTFIDSHV